MADEDDAVDDTISLSTAAQLLGRKPGEAPLMACCPRDDEPLVATLEFRGAEFFCVICEGKFGFLAPTPKPTTPQLQARHSELKGFYDSDRAQRLEGI